MTGGGVPAPTAVTDGAGGDLPVGAAAVIVAGGTGSRIGGTPKQFREIGGHPMLAWSCARFGAHPDIDAVLVVLPAEIAAAPPTWLSWSDVRLAVGGSSRRASVRAGLAALAEDGPEQRVVLIHDAARPFVSATLIGLVARAAIEGPVIPVLPLADTIKRMRSRRGEDEARIDSTLDRSRLCAAQTPQGFPLELIRRLHEAAAGDGLEPPDDAALCERAGVDVRTVPGERIAWKITEPEDLDLAEWLVASGRVGWPGGPT